VPPHRALEWHELVGAGFGDGTLVEALATLPNGDLVAGGWFTTCGRRECEHHRALEWHELVGAGFGMTATW
jgi:hypothetical protein